MAPLSDRIRKLAEKFSGPPQGEPESTKAVPAWSTSDPQPLMDGRVSCNSFQVPHTLLDASLTHTAIPTNTWWQNLVVDQGDQPVVTTPYMVKCLDASVVVCAPTQLAQETFVASVWHDDWRVHIDGCTGHKVVEFDPLSVAVEYASLSGTVRVPLVRGAVFVTVVFDAPTQLVMSTVHAVVGVDIGCVPGTAVVRLNSGTTWLVCCEDSTATLQQTDVSTLMSSGPVVGAVRIALVNSSDQALAALLQAKDTVPVGGTVDVTSDDDEALFTIGWKTRGPADRLLMCALPHHQAALADGTCWADDVGEYWTSMGRVRAVVGAQWQWTEKLEPLGFAGQHELNGADRDVLQDLVQKDADSLPNDCAVLPPDPYFFGKAVARATRIALIADEVGESASCSVAVDRAAAWLDPWLLGTNENRLVYDSAWRGVVSTAGLTDAQADFGQGRYNDHHFHYGYFVYAAAALTKLRPDWLTPARLQAIDILARDYCNASADDGHFPFMRCFDFYEGHSVASGLFAFADSRNQESTSEAVNAYYAAYLYALATGRTQIARYVRAILQLEARTSRVYWHLGDLAEDIYPEVYARGRAVVGILWSSKADYATFFGANPEFIYGIQLLPYTPAMSLLLKRQWVADIWPRFLETVADNSETESWREIINLAYAVVDKQATKDRTSKNTEHDDGNSASNSYYWIATA
ncbi:hypothetical protein GGI20_002139 [Coemansia sp. BCRC 34301]|nr:hypothetical protein GGI20_002139 [Coemansia sp. BCRC 34301]